MTWGHGICHGSGVCPCHLWPEQEGGQPWYPAHSLHPPGDRQLPCVVVVKLWKGQVIVTSTELLVACKSVLSFVKHMNKNAAGFVQVKESCEAEGSPAYIIHSVSTIYLLAPLS